MSIKLKWIESIPWFSFFPPEERNIETQKTASDGSFYFNFFVSDREIEDGYLVLEVANPSYGGYEKILPLNDREPLRNLDLVASKVKYMKVEILNFNKNYYNDYEMVFSKKFKGTIDGVNQVYVLKNLHYPSIDSSTVVLYPLIAFNQMNYFTYYKKNSPTEVETIIDSLIIKEGETMVLTFQ